MRSLRNDQRGMAYAAVTALSTLIIIGIAWNLFSPVLEEEVFGYCEAELREDNNFDELKPTYDMIHWIWDYWPLIMIFAVVLYLFLASQRPSSPY